MFRDARRQAMLAAVSLCVGLVGVAPTPAQASTNTGAALTPPMGWSAWSSERCNATEQSALAEGQAMATTLESHGYQYINLDCGWQGGWNGNGLPTWSATKFPDGLPYLASKLHSMGLKFGVYMNPGLSSGQVASNPPIQGTSYHLKDIVLPGVNGNTTGSGAIAIDFTKPGSHEFIQSYANLYASWGVDWIKMDFVGPGGGHVPADNRAEIQAWNQAIVNTGRPIVLELSNSLSITAASWWKQYAGGWRIEGDVEAYHSSPPTLTDWAKVSLRFADLPNWVQYAGPGGWNDLDSLDVGNGATDGLTPDQRQSAVTLWSIGCAPLILGADLTKLDPADLPLITNDEVIAVNQAGISAAPLQAGVNQPVWVSHQADGSYVVGLFNLGTGPATVSVTWSQLGFSGSASVRDLWSHTDLGTMATGFSATLNTDASRLVRVYPGGQHHTVPGAATAVSGTAQGGGQAVVTWTAPANNGGSPITAYAAYIYGSDGSSQILESTGTSTAVTGLSPGTYYAFTVTAYNASGWGAWSAWSPWLQAT